MHLCACVETLTKEEASFTTGQLRISRVFNRVENYRVVQFVVDYRVVQFVVVNYRVVQFVVNYRVVQFVVNYRVVQLAVDYRVVKFVNGINMMTMDDLLLFTFLRRLHLSIYNTIIVFKCCEICEQSTLYTSKALLSLRNQRSRNSCQKVKTKFDRHNALT